MSVSLMKSSAKPHRHLSPAGPLSELRVSTRVGKQSKCLVVELKPRITASTIEIYDRVDGPIGTDEVLAKIRKRVICRLAPGAGPAEPAGFAIGEGLPRDGARTMRMRHRCAIQVDSLMEATPVTVGSPLPPQPNRAVEKPVPKRVHLRRKIRHFAPSALSCPCDTAHPPHPLGVMDSGLASKSAKPTCPRPGMTPRGPFGAGARFCPSCRPYRTTSQQCPALDLLPSRVTLRLKSCAWRQSAGIATMVSTC